MLTLMPRFKVHGPDTRMDLFLTCVANARGQLNSFQAGINTHGNDCCTHDGLTAGRWRGLTEPQFLLCEMVEPAS